MHLCHQELELVVGAATGVPALSYLAWRLRHVWRHVRCRLTGELGGATKGSCIDQEAREAATQTPVVGMTQYVVVRGDLPHGQQMAQCAHAAGEAPGPRPVPGTHVVVLHARDEAHVVELAAALRAGGVEHHVVLEPLPARGYHEFMAIGLAPVADRARVARVLGALPLARERGHRCHNRGCPD